MKIYSQFTIYINIINKIFIIFSYNYDRMKEQNEQLKIAEKKLIDVRKSLKQVQVNH